MVSWLPRNHYQHSWYNCRFEQRLQEWFHFIIVQVIEFTIRPNLFCSRSDTKLQPANPQSSPNNPIVRKLVKQAVRKVADGYIFENGTSRYVFAKELSAETVAAIDIFQTESLSHVLGAKKITISSSDQFLQQGLWFIAKFIKIWFHKGRQVWPLDKLLERLNDISKWQNQVNWYSCFLAQLPIQSDSIKM